MCCISEDRAQLALRHHQRAELLPPLSSSSRIINQIGLGVKRACHAAPGPTGHDADTPQLLGLSACHAQAAKERKGTAEPEAAEGDGTPGAGPPKPKKKADKASIFASKAKAAAAHQQAKASATPASAKKAKQVPSSPSKLKAQGSKLSTAPSWAAFTGQDPGLRG